MMKTRSKNPSRKRRVGASRLPIALPPLAAALALLVAVASFAPSDVHADESADLIAFEAANGLYESGNFDEAARTYQRLAALGYEDATLYYNLGNSYYKTDDVGRAVLNYLRARRLAPYDRDIQTNLAVARQQVESADAGETRLPVIVQLSDLLPWISFNAAAGLALVCWLALAAVGAARLWNRRLRASPVMRRVAVGLAVGVVAFGCVAVAHYLTNQRWESVAVITVGPTEARSGPGARYPVRIELSAGHEVRLSESRGGWSKIAVPKADVEGWIPAASVERVVEAKTIS